ncbi:hypothetical protein [Lactobacillus psittaci]|uniref:Uncharacterized protein n=1 Tax=Lactobacillus psittaci DSM 15354 TaxID=1122152 RepID=A0A0R1SEP8_9LACO|nr:hypothetical protein [Lactobacillus psittaci]KRL63643.1 hypothetical protein FC23_GL000552 [Lactobacillus psittaci DSM 15354]
MTTIRKVFKLGLKDRVRLINKFLLFQLAGTLLLTLYLFFIAKEKITGMPNSILSIFTVQVMATSFPIDFIIFIFLMGRFANDMRHATWHLVPLSESKIFITGFLTNIVAYIYTAVLQGIALFLSLLLQYNFFSKLFRQFSRNLSDKVFVGKLNEVLRISSQIFILVAVVILSLCLLLFLVSMLTRIILRNIPGIKGESLSKTVMVVVYVILWIGISKLANLLDMIHINGLKFEDDLGLTIISSIITFIGLLLLDAFIYQKFDQAKVD